MADFSIHYSPAPVPAPDQSCQLKRRAPRFIIIPLTAARQNQNRTKVRGYKYLRRQLFPSADDRNETTIRRTGYFGIFIRLVNFFISLSFLLHIFLHLFLPPHFSFSGFDTARRGAPPSLDAASLFRVKLTIHRFHGTLPLATVSQSRYHIMNRHAKLTFHFNKFNIMARVFSSDRLLLLLLPHFLIPVPTPTRLRQCYRVIQTRALIVNLFIRITTPLHGTSD